MTKSEVIKEFFKKSVLPVAVAALLYCIFKSVCTKDGVTDYQRRRSETDHLSFGQPEQDLALYPTQVLRDCYISQCFTPPSSSAHSP